MKKIYKKILLVILILAVGSVSVYAWAYINNRIDINGVQVKPSGTEGLYIAKSGESSFSVTVNASTESAQTLSAVSTADLNNWYIPENTGTITENGDYNSTFVLINNSNKSDYYYSERFDIQTTEGLASLKVSGITVTDAEGNTPSENISKALRVGIKTNTSSSAYIFAPVDGYDDCEVIGQDGAKVSQTIKNVGTTVMSPVGAGDTYTITIFVWYEGQDGNYNMENLYNPEDLIISIEFTGVGY